MNTEKEQKEIEEKWQTERFRKADKLYPRNG